MMTMKSKLLQGSLLLTSAFVLAACGGGSSNDAAEDTSATTEEVADNTAADMEMSDEPLQDGTYTLETDYDERGWKVEFTIEVENGEIVSSNYDYVNEDGDLKSDDEEYNTAMKDETGTSAAEAMDQLNAALVETQNPADVEVVSGATHTSEAFKDYAMQLVKAAQEGNTDTIQAD